MTSIHLGKMSKRTYGGNTAGSSSVIYRGTSQCCIHEMDGFKTSSSNISLRCIGDWVLDHSQFRMLD